MIDTLLSKLGGLLTPSFLYASFLPVFCLVMANLAIATLVVGPEGVAIWFGALDAGLKGWITAGLFIAIFILAYVLSSLHGLILRLWSGTLLAIPGLTDGLARRKRREFDALREAKFAKEPWKAEFERFRGRLGPVWSRANRAALDDGGRRKAEDVLEQVTRENDPARFAKILDDDIVPLFEAYDGEALTNFYRQVQDTLERRAETAGADITADRIRLDLAYGRTYARIRPTRLGNIVEAYNDYPYDRYGIDGTLFWPRLTQVMPKDFGERIQEKKTFLDFALAMATGAVVTALVVPVYGPFLGGDLQLTVWLAISAIAAVVAIVFYRVAIAAAEDFGHTLRAACDLLRLDLMAALGRPRPPDLKTERARWEELSQLAAFGTIPDFVLEVPKPKVEDTC
jgi:hypothetical protein